MMQHTMSAASLNREWLWQPPSLRQQHALLNSICRSIADGAGLSEPVAAFELVLECIAGHGTQYYGFQLQLSGSSLLTFMHKAHANGVVNVLTPGAQEHFLQLPTSMKLTASLLPNPTSTGTCSTNEALLCLPLLCNPAHETLSALFLAPSPQALLATWMHYSNSSESIGYLLLSVRPSVLRQLYDPDDWLCNLLLLATMLAPQLLHSCKQRMVHAAVHVSGLLPPSLDCPLTTFLSERRAAQALCLQSTVNTPSTTSTLSEDEALPSMAVGLCCEQEDDQQGSFTDPSFQHVYNNHMASLFDACRQCTCDNHYHYVLGTGLLGLKPPPEIALPPGLLANLDVSVLEAVMQQMTPEQLQQLPLPVLRALRHAVQLLLEEHDESEADEGDFVGASELMDEASDERSSVDDPASSISLTERLPSASEGLTEHSPFLITESELSERERSGVGTGVSNLAGDAGGSSVQGAGSARPSNVERLRMLRQRNEQLCREEHDRMQGPGSPDGDDDEGPSLQSVLSPGAKREDCALESDSFRQGSWTTPAAVHAVPAQCVAAEAHPLDFSEHQTNGASSVSLAAQRGGTSNEGNRAEGMQDSTEEGKAVKTTPEPPRAQAVLDFTREQYQLRYPASQTETLFLQYFITSAAWVQGLVLLVMLCSTATLAASSQTPSQWLSVLCLMLALLLSCISPVRAAGGAKRMEAVRVLLLAAFAAPAAIQLLLTVTRYTAPTQPMHDTSESALELQLVWLALLGTVLLGLLRPIRFTWAWRLCAATAVLLMAWVPWLGPVLFPDLSTLQCMLVTLPFIVSVESWVLWTVHHGESRDRDQFEVNMAQQQG